MPAVRDSVEASVWESVVESIASVKDSVDAGNDCPEHSSEENRNVGD
jgi:hypothetical protein